MKTRLTLIITLVISIFVYSDDGTTNDKENKKGDDEKIKQELIQRISQVKSGIFRDENNLDTLERIYALFNLSPDSYYEIYQRDKDGALLYYALGGVHTHKPLE